eukprot:c49085_g1_i1 orf=3-200(-)
MKFCVQQCSTTCTVHENPSQNLSTNHQRYNENEVKNEGIVKMSLDRHFQFILTVQGFNFKVLLSKG